LLTGKELFSKFNVHQGCKSACIVGKHKHKATFKDTKVPLHFGKVLRDNFSEVLQKYSNENLPLQGWLHSCNKENTKRTRAALANLQWITQSHGKALTLPQIITMQVWTT
jgi:hypothetical protein